MPGATDVRGTGRRPRGSSAPASARTSPTSSSAGCARIGIPARYVSGYVHPDADPVVGATVTGYSHAWVEWWDDGWHAFDPCHHREPDDRYVSLAHGRDYLDVTPDQRHLLRRRHLADDRRRSRSPAWPDRVQ